jgi:drug/metabolite transporter (DMT)-like permease
MEIFMLVSAFMLVCGCVVIVLPTFDKSKGIGWMLIAISFWVIALSLASYLRQIVEMLK